MEQNMRVPVLERYLGFFFLFCIFSNLINPITPTFFLSLQLPDYMFGVAFAAMCMGCFLSAPLWGRFCERWGSRNLIIWNFAFYCLCQMGFAFARTQFSIVITRFAGGVACSAIDIAIMAYLINQTTLQNRHRYILIFSSGMTVCIAVGYSIGGFLGSLSVNLAFVVQIVTILSFTLAMCFTTTSEPVPAATKSIHETQQTVKTRVKVPFPVKIFLFEVTLASFASTNFDNAFNYFIRAEMNFPDYYNGIIRAGIGVITLVLNLTVTAWILRRNLRIFMIPILCGCGISASIVPFAGRTGPFIVMSLLFFGFNAVYLPVQQAILSSEEGIGGGGTIAGKFNLMWYAGKIIGSLFAGFSYMLGSRLPFIFAGLVFLFSAGVAVWNHRLSTQEKSN